MIIPTPNRRSNRMKAIAKISKTQSVRMRHYSLLKRSWIKQHPRCEACWPIHHRLPRAARDVHHTLGRIGDLLFLTQFWKAVCRECHNWIGANPAKARQLKLLAPKGQWNTIPKSKP